MDREVYPPGSFRRREGVILEAPELEERSSLGAHKRATWRTEGLVQKQREKGLQGGV